MLNIKEQNKKAIDSQRANIIIFIFKFFWGAGLRNISFFLFFRKRLFMPLHTQRAPLTQRVERSESGKQQPHQQELRKISYAILQVASLDKQEWGFILLLRRERSARSDFFPLPRNLEQTKPTEVIYRDEHDNRREEKKMKKRISHFQAVRVVVVSLFCHLEFLAMAIDNFHFVRQHCSPPFFLPPLYLDLLAHRGLNLSHHLMMFVLFCCCCESLNS